MNFVQNVSIDINNITAEEKNWLRAAFDCISDEPWEKAYDWTDDGVPLTEDGAPLLEPGTLAHELLFKVPALFNDEELSWGFNLQFDALNANLFSDEWGGNVDAMLEFLRLFLSLFRPAGKLGFTWGWQEGGAGGGGAAVVTATLAEVITTSGWLEDKMKEKT